CSRGRDSEEEIKVGQFWGDYLRKLDRIFQGILIFLALQFLGFRSSQISILRFSFTFPLCMKK
ncbi:hypothetical protein, partial [Escherichia coli]|uniref:hypothetical protein n=1 Tax=Escherichia coli TaxID=562 RepID=UPI0032D9D83B